MIFLKDLEDYMMLNKKVKEIMTTGVITTTPDIDVVYAFEKLMEHKISSLPVVIIGNNNCN